MSLRMLARTGLTARALHERRPRCPSPLIARVCSPSFARLSAENTRGVRTLAGTQSLVSKDATESPEDFFSQIEKSMERAMNRAFAPFSISDPLFSSSWPLTSSKSLLPNLSFSPAESSRLIPMDVVERDNEYELTFDTPGLRPEDVSVEIHDDFVKVHGSRKQVKEDKGRVLKCEINSYSFSRALPLPADAKSDGVVASLEDGVLRVTIPKNPESQKKAEPKRVPVCGGTSKKLAGGQAAGSEGASKDEEMKA